MAIAEEIYQILHELKGQIPPAIDVHVIFDRSIPVRDAIKDANKHLSYRSYFLW